MAVMTANKVQKLSPLNRMRQSGRATAARRDLVKLQDVAESYGFHKHGWFGTWRSLIHHLLSKTRNLENLET